MGVELNLWKIEGKIASALQPAQMPTEQLLETLLDGDISILDSELLVIGRQFHTPNRKRLDILAISGDGSLTVIELKKGQTEREVVTQALDYGSWVQKLTRADLVAMFAARHGGDLEKEFHDHYGIELPEDLSGEHRLVIVAAALDDETQRIVDYLAAFGVPINAVFFRYFEDGEHRFLARTWLRDPDEVDAVSAATSATKRQLGPWNGNDFYVSFLPESDRDWEDARRLGFISAGGGRWYTRTLHNLAPGNRVFVRIPSTGYVGVGHVTQRARLARDVTVVVSPGETVPLVEAVRNSPTIDHDGDDPERGEQVVLVDWLRTVSIGEAFHEPGLFGNQNSACKLRDQRTIDRVSEHFGITGDGSA